MVRCTRCISLMQTAALALSLSCCCAVAARVTAQEMLPGGAPGAPVAEHWDTDVVGYPQQSAQPAPAGQAWITPPPNQSLFPSPGMMPNPGMNYADPGWGGPPVIVPGVSDAWCWQALPDGLIYRSYWAGVHEPRLGVVAQSVKGGDAFIDGTLGARVGLLRYGTVGPNFPQGFELDVEAAALVRLTLDEMRDFETADYRVGVPLTYGVDSWQYKLAVYHLSSHLGDEYAINHPGSLDDRINYVRDEVVLGASYYPELWCRLYAEIGYAFNSDGGAEPWEVQFGTELSRPGPTGNAGTPFAAFNGHLREEVDWGGDLSAQLGWLWRNNSGQVFRAGLHYFNGKSSQFQTFNQFEQQIGVGLWYDF